MSASPPSSSSSSSGASPASAPTNDQAIINMLLELVEECPEGYYDPMATSLFIPGAMGDNDVTFNLKEMVKSLIRMGIPGIVVSTVGYFLATNGYSSQSGYDMTLRFDNNDFAAALTTDVNKATATAQGAGIMDPFLMYTNATLGWAHDFLLQHGTVTADGSKIEFRLSTFKSLIGHRTLSQTSEAGALSLGRIVRLTIPYSVATHIRSPAGVPKKFNSFGDAEHDQWWYLIGSVHAADDAKSILGVLKVAVTEDAYIPYNPDGGYPSQYEQTIRILRNRHFPKGNGALVANAQKALKTWAIEAGLELMTQNKKKSSN